MESIPELMASLLEGTLAGQDVGPSISTPAAPIPESELLVEEPRAQEVITTQPAIDATHMTPEVVDDEPLHTEVVALGREVTPTVAVFEAVAPMAEEVMPRVPIPGLFRGLPALSALPRLMEGRAFSVHIPEASKSMVPMATTDIPPPSDAATDLLKGGLDTSPFEGLLARPQEPVGFPSLFYSPVMARLIISQLLPSLASVTEVSDMVRLVNEAFQCLGSFNLDLRQAYDRLFHLLCLRRRLLMLEGALEKLPPRESIAPELGSIQEQIQTLQGTALHILADFNYVSKLANGLRYSIGELRIILDDLEKELAQREADLVKLGDAHADFGNLFECLHNIAQSAEQVAALEEELAQVRKAAEELSGLLKQDYL